MEDHTDSALLRSWLAGDREAFAVIVARHHGLVQAACRRQAPPTEVDDCVQAVFLILARKPGSAARAPVLAAWLQRVSWFVCRTAKRSVRRRRQAEREAAQAVSSDGGRNEALEHLDDCLLKLPARQREAVVLHYLAGKPAEEVAASLGTSRDNAYQLISRGLNALRSLLERRGIAVASAALLSLLAAEAQAAGASAPAAVLATITTAPSTGAAAIAQGAQTAMTITALSPIAAAAGLVLAAGVLSVALAAEQPVDPNTAPRQTTPIATTPAATTPAAGPARQGVPGGVANPSSQVPGTTRASGPNAAPTQTGLNGAPTPSPLAVNLAKEITLDFQDTPLTDAVTFIKRASGVDFIVEPAEIAYATVTLKVDKMQVGKVLGMMEQLNGLTHSIVGERYRIHRP